MLSEFTAWRETRWRAPPSFAPWDMLLTFRDQRVSVLQSPRRDADKRRVKPTWGRRVGVVRLVMRPKQLLRTCLRSLADESSLNNTPSKNVWARPPRHPVHSQTNQSELSYSRGHHAQGPSEAPTPTQTYRLFLRFRSLVSLRDLLSDPDDPLLDSLTESLLMRRLLPVPR